MKIILTSVTFLGLCAVSVQAADLTETTSIASAYGDSSDLFASFARVALACSEASAPGSGERLRDRLLDPREIEHLRKGLSSIVVRNEDLPLLSAVMNNEAAVVRARTLVYAQRRREALHHLFVRAISVSIMRPADALACFLEGTSPSSL